MQIDFWLIKEYTFTIMNQKVLSYDAVFEKEADGGYSVWIPDLPGCASQGDTLEKAIENIKEAAELYLEDADEDKKEVILGW